MVLSREMTERIRQVLEKYPEGISITDLVKSVDVNRNTAGRYLENMLLSGQVEMRRFGMAKLYTLTKRLPASSVLSLSSELVMQLDNGLRVFYANDPLLIFLSAPAKDLFGKNIEFTPFSIVFEDVFSELRDRFRNGLRGEEWHGELSSPVRERFFFCRIAPTVTSEGKKGVSVLLDDITDQRRDEERIRQSEARLRSIFKVSPVGIGVVADRILREVNDRFCEITGYTSEELVGRSIRMLYPSEEEFRIVGALYMSQIRQSGASSIETQWVKKDGAVIDVLMNSTPLDPSTISGGITFTALDITERKRAERALRESEQRLVAAQRIASLGDVSLDIGTGEVTWSQGMYDLLQYDRSVKINGRINRETHHPEDRERLVKWLHDSLSSGSNVIPPIEYRVIRKDGRVLNVHTTGEIQYVDGKPVRAFVTLQDITEQKLAQDALRESEERLQLALSGSETGMWELEIPAMKGVIDERAAAILGYLKADIGQLRADWDTLSHPDDVPLIHQRLSDYLEGRAILFESEHRMRHASGRWIWVVGRGKTTHRSGDGSFTKVSGTLQDITARKKAEQAVRESEEKYRHLVEQSLQGLTVIQNGRPVFANATMLEIGGFSYDEYLALSPDELMATVHPEDRDHIRKVMAARLEGKIFSAENEFRILRKGGEVRWVLTRGMLIMYNGAPAIQVAYFDITKRKLAEDALRESEDRYRKLVEISPNAVLLHRDGKIIYANRALAEILGTDRIDDLLGRDVLDLIHPASRETIRANIAKDLTGISTPFMELQMVREDGTLVIVQGQGVGTSIEGRPAVLVAITDVTERKLAEDALREAVARYRTLAEASQDLIYLIGNDDRVEYVNSYAAATLGLSADQVIGKKRSSLFSTEMGKRQAQGLRRVFETGKAGRSEGAMEISGTLRWFDHYLEPIMDAHGTVISVLGVSRDITDRKQAEDALRASEERYRYLLDTLFDAVAIHQDEKIFFLNERAAHILGAATPRDLIGRSIFDLIHPDSLSDLQDRIQMMDAEPGRPAEVLREKFFRVDGTTVTVDVTALRITVNEFPAIQVMFREVTSPHRKKGSRKKNQ